LITGGAGGIGYEFTEQLRHLVTRFLSRAAIKLRWTVRKRLSKNSHLSEATFPIRKRSPLYEEVTKLFPELNILINTPASCVRSMFTTKPEAWKISLERFKSI